MTEPVKRPVWLGLYFPALPLEVLPDSASDVPLVIETQQRGRRLVSLANAAALAAGIRTGTSIPTALGLATALRVCSRNLTLESQALEHLASIAAHYTPCVHLPIPEMLLLDVTGSLKLFGGQKRLVNLLLTQLQSVPYRFYCGLSSTPKAAALLAKAHYLQATGHLATDKPAPEVGKRKLNEAKSEEATYLDGDANQLGRYPLNASEIALETRSQLESMGLRTIQDIVNLPYSALANRFGLPLTDYLARLTGSQSDPQPIYQFPKRFERTWQVNYEIIDTERLLFPLRPMLESLEWYLSARHLSCREIRLAFGHREQHQELIIELASPQQKAHYWLRAVRQRLEQLSLSQPVMQLTLQAEHFLPCQATQTDLFDNVLAATPTLEAKANLLDALHAKLGQNAVYTLKLHDDHRPELASKLHSVKLHSVKLHPVKLLAENIGDTLTTELPDRPHWLIDPPQPLHVLAGSAMPVNQAVGSTKSIRFAEFQVELCSGPERIQTGWWDANLIFRDYFWARRTDGSLIWIYFDHLDPAGWHWHGLMD
jgi:protein ImuB